MKKPTALGKRLRELRLEYHMMQGEVAKELEMTASFWSAIEVGKKPLPENKLAALARVFKLGEEGIAELKNLAQDYKTAYTLNVVGLEEEKRIFVATFARQLEDLPLETIRKMRNMLGE